MAEGKPFLAARWLYLAMINYEVAPAILQPYVPAGTELDSWQGKTFVSMVGFRFLDTRVRGLPVPGHRNFDEVNLRFYVRQRGPEGWRRGVVFIKELVPRWAIATVARVVYNENYQSLPMRHRVAMDPAGDGGTVAYEWRWQGRWARLQVTVAGQPAIPGPQDEATFITEHYWGYARQRDGRTLAYQVAHPQWSVWPATDSQFECDVAGLYGPEFAEPLAAAPSSAFLADGSAVVVYQGKALD